jgi:tetratricopeptide (TPR) repeat protein
MVRFRFFPVLISILAFAALTAFGPGFVAPVAAQPAPSAEAPAKPRPQRTPPNLDFLFGALKVAPDAASAKAIEDRIWGLWLASNSDTANLLMSRVKEAIAAQDLDLALQLLDATVEVAPRHVEAWNRRATLHYMKREIGAALMDLRQVLALEPRHFGAMSGLGLILQDLGEDKRALEVYRRAIAIHPHLPRLPDLIKTLKEKVDGRDI